MALCVKTNKNEEVVSYLSLLSVESETKTQKIHSLPQFDPRQLLAEVREHRMLVFPRLVNVELKLGNPDLFACKLGGGGVQARGDRGMPDYHLVDVRQQAGRVPDELLWSLPDLVAARI